MGRKIPSGMYRNAFLREKSPEYERHYRLATMEMLRWLRPKRKPYKRQTEWFEQMYPKVKPGRYCPRMARDHDDNWHLPNEQMRLKSRLQQRRK